MKVTLKKLPKSTMELTIEVPYDIYQKSEKRALGEVSKNLKVDGFRPGHVPEAIVRQRVTPAMLTEYTLNFVIPQTYSQAIKEQKVSAIAQPQVDVKEWVKKEGDTFIYVASVAVMPEVKLDDYKKIKVTRDKVTVTEKQLEEVMQEILDRFATFHDVEREAKMNDRVEIDFEGFDPEGKSIPNTRSKNHPIVLGSKTFIPGFEEAILGMKKGETKDFDVTFPQEYHDAKLKGAKVKFKVTLNRLEEKKTPELSEETIEKISQKKQSIADFKKQVEADFKAELEYRARQDQESKIIEAIIKATKAELPESLIQEELKFLLEQQKEYLKGQGLSWEQYLTHTKKTEEDFFKDNRERAEKNILARLGFQHIVQAEKIVIEDKEVEGRVQEMLTQYNGDQQSKVKDYYRKDSEGWSRIKNQLAVDRMIALFAE